MDSSPESSDRVQGEHFVSPPTTSSTSSIFGGHIPAQPSLLISGSDTSDAVQNKPSQNISLMNITHPGRSSQTPHTPQPRPQPTHAISSAPMVSPPTFKTPVSLDVRAHTGLHLPIAFPTPSAIQTPMDVRALTGLHLPLVSPTPSAPSPVSSQNSGKLDNASAFQRSQELFRRNQAKKALEDQQASGSSKASALPASIPKKRTFETSLEEERDFMTNYMPAEGDDHSWMEEPDEEVDLELDALAKQFTDLNSKDKAGTITVEEKMELIQAENRLLQINRSRGDVAHQDDEEEDPNSLFIPESRDATVARHRQNKATVSSPYSSEIEDDDDDIRLGVDDSDVLLASMLGRVLDGDGIDDIDSTLGADKGLKANGEPRQRRRNKTAKDVYAYNQAKADEKQREKSLKKPQKKKAGTPLSSSTTKSKSKSKSKGNGKGKESAKSKKAAKKGKGKEKALKDGPSLLRPAFQDGPDEIANDLLRSLALGDPISERLSNPIFKLGSGPEITGKFNKTTQFAKLFANIPPGTSAATTKSDKKKLLKASKSFGNGKIKAVDGKWHLKGMAESTTLYHHQLLGAKWMMDREFSQEAPHGGILADGMGLGKTIQSLALMIANTPEPADLKRGVKATLIVAPASIVNQWFEEIEYHTLKETFPKVVKYKGSSNLSVNILQDMDIVVASYHDIMKQFPYPDAEAKKQIALIGRDAWLAKAAREMGPLHQVAWYRVILDEAHAIKNNNARTSLACQNLKSIYRWCLTGTPLMNRLEELFPYLRFLKANLGQDFPSFQKFFCDGSVESHARIATLLSFAMIRRTMDCTILGRALITLPEPKTEVRKISFSPGERIVYRITEGRFRANLNKFFARGDASRNYGTFMVQLLRLRQCTSHPFMLEQTIRESWTLEDVEELKYRLSRLDDRELRPFYKQVECWVGDRTEADDPEKVVLPFGQGDFGHSFQFGKVLESLNEKEMASRTTCGMCGDYPVGGKKTSCHHVFCRDCIFNSIHENMAQQEHTVCPICDVIFDIDLLEDVNPVDPSSPSADEDPVLDANGERRSKKRKIANNSKGIDMLGHEPWTDSTWVPKSDYDDKFPFCASSKTAALKAILLGGFDSDPMDKVVVYVQFRTLARIVARICQSEGWGFLYLTGDTSQDHRTKVIAKFRSDPDAKILIAGLKCGGLGLNFPFANRCISLDLWWNHAVEQQAMGRLFRIGQNKTTHFTRLAVHNSVDMRMLNLQLHKLLMVEKAIKDGPDTTPALSLHQLANLFGFLRTDDDDNIVSIEADYDDAAEWEAGRRPGSSGSAGSGGSG